MKNIKEIKKFLLEEIADRKKKDTPKFIKEPCLENSLIVTPYFTKHGTVDLQFWGWCIVLCDDGTWYWQATDGG